MPRVPLVLCIAIASLVWGACASSGRSSEGSSAQSEVPLFEVTARSLNLRQEPSTSGAIVGSLSEGERVGAPRPADGGWLYVETPSGAVGYVSAQYVSPVAGSGGAARQSAAAAPEPERQQTAAPEEPRARRPIPGTPLARIELGMAEAQVIDILGEPTSQESYMTGKAWIPYYYGPDTSRLDYKYENVGIVVFGRNRYSGKTRVIRVDHDSDEDGL